MPANPPAAELLRGDEMLEGFMMRPGAREKGTEGDGEHGGKVDMCWEMRAL